VKPIVRAILLGTAMLSSGCATTVAFMTPAPQDPLHAWLGTWSGTATNHRPDGSSFDFPMTLAIAPIDGAPDRYTWTITYGEGERQQIRPYELVMIDGASGLYAIDEKNSIVLNTTMLDGALYSQFEIEGVRLTTVNRLGPGSDQMTCEILTTSVDPASITGNNGSVPTVGLFPPRSLQRAVLTRSATPD
jgi:hypothetical protein